MSEPILDDADALQPEPVRTSYWRLAMVLAVAVGAGIFFGGRIAAKDDSGLIPSQAVIYSGMLAPWSALLGFVLFWILLGDGRWIHRIIGVLCSALVFAVAVVAAHPSVRVFEGMWGLPLSVGITGLALVATPNPAWRRSVGALAWILAITPWLLIRQDEGVTSTFGLDPSYRWKPSTAELADAQLSDRSTSEPTEAVNATAVETVSNEDWPGFRGAIRNGEVSAEALHGWNGSPPHERWRHDIGAVGPAWSSFCIVGNSLFTQEQRGKSESVVCYQADSGKEVWSRGEPSLHNDIAGGTGPRATPTYANGLVYAISATGQVSCLRAANGQPVWNVNLVERFNATKPVFGLSTSPYIFGDLAFVNPASATAPRLVALDAATGATRWVTEAMGTDGYSSPQVSKIDGVEQVLLFNGAGLFGHDPATGKELWHYDWKVSQNEPTTVQPLVTPDGRIVVGGGNVGLGCRCIAVKKEGDGWSAKEAWRTTRFTPKFNDVVRLGDYFYGLDGGSLACIKMATGERMWKEGTYGAGQLLLTGDKLLILSETGQIACVLAKPDEYEELWKVDALKKKTWNHPAIARGRLFIRNMGEMVAYDLPGTTEEKTSKTPAGK